MTKLSWQHVTWDNKKHFVLLCHQIYYLHTKSLCRHLTSNERTSMEDEDLDLWAELNNGLHSFICQAGTAAHVHLLYNVKNRCEYSVKNRCEQCFICQTGTAAHVHLLYNVKNRCEQCLTMAFIPLYAI